jgi:hypothetical protein
MKRVEVHIPAADVAVVRKAAAILRNPAEAATRLRRFLGFETESDRTVTALDIFAMPAPLSAAGEALWDEAMAQVERERRDQQVNRLRIIDP